MVKFQRDVRYDEFQVTTHDGIAINAVKCEYLYELDDIVTKYDVVCIDEIQFYKDGYIMCDKWANQGLIVNACGLSGDFNREPFPVVSKLIAISDDIVLTKAVCRSNGSDAVYSKLVDVPKDANSQELIGGADMYQAVDRVTYFGDVDKQQFELYKKFVDFYRNNIDVTINCDQLATSYDNSKNFKELISNK